MNFLLDGPTATLFPYSHHSVKCPYSEIFWSVFSRIRAEYGEIPPISQYSVQMRENTDQNNSEYRHFLRSALVYAIYLSSKKCLFSNIQMASA